MEESLNTQRLPETDSIRELAEFWDKHDLTEFEDQLEEVDQRVFERRTGITVRLETNEAQVVRQMAQSQGIVDSDLIRLWILERIHAT
jgi:hypothetical protein